MRHIKIMALLAVCVGWLAFGKMVAISAKSPLLQPATPSPTPQTAVAHPIFISDGRTIRLWQPATAQETPFATIIPTEPSQEVDDYQIDPKAHIVYWVEEPPVVLHPFNQHLPPRPTKLVQVDANQNRKVLLEGFDFFDLTLSPDADQIAIVFSENGWGSHLRICIYNIKSGKCSRVDMTFAMPFQMGWVDNQTLIATPGGGRLYEVNTGSSQGQVIAGLEAWYIYRFASIPQTRTLMIGGHPRKNTVSRFITYDLNTSDLKELKLDAPDFSYRDISDVQISSDQRYMIYRLGGAECELIELSTGRRITEIKNIGGINWLPDSSAYVTTTTTSGVTEVWQFDPQTGQLKRISEDQGSVGLVTP